MKCLIIHGSPRRGNSWDVLGIVKDEMQRNGSFEFETIELIKENIPNCIGCFNCIYKGEEKCPHSNKINEIVEKIDDSDAIIITSPVYSMQVSGILKTFIDHLSFNFHRPKFYIKKALIITTTAGAGHKDVAKYLKNVMEYWGINYIMTIPIAYRSYSLTEKNRNKIIYGAERFSKELLSRNIHQPTFKGILMYNMWKSASRKDKENMIADYNYWNKSNLKDTIYYPGINIGILKKTFANIVVKILN